MRTIGEHHPGQNTINWKLDFSEWAFSGVKRGMMIGILTTHREDLVARLGHSMVVIERRIHQEHFHTDANIIKRRMTTNKIYEPKIPLV